MAARIVVTLCSFTLAVGLSAFAHADENPPAGGDALYEWLTAGSYKEWNSESGQHKSAGPHPQAVIAYVNKLLDQSLAAGADSHPKGSAAVKELYDSNGILSGWAVSLKTQPDSAAGKGWYWYEMLGTSKDSTVVADGNGVGLCLGCHTPGRDFVLIPYPLK